MPNFVRAPTTFDPAWQAAQVRREAQVHRQPPDFINKLLRSRQ
ncbi:hypothetical protein [Micromonospora sp. NPDC005203]